ncbi:hypothetical protein GCM10023259_034890 [Thermocatellispora tengchongensis]
MGAVAGSPLRHRGGDVRPAVLELRVTIAGGELWWEPGTLVSRTPSDGVRARPSPGFRRDLHQAPRGGGGKGESSLAI